MMNSVPNYLVIQTSCYTSSNCKSQFSLKSLPQQSKYLSTFRIIWQISNSCSSWKAYSFSISSFHCISNDYGSLLVSLTSNIFVFNNCHRTFRLISCHFSKDCRTNRAFCPFLLSYQINEAYFVIFVRASQQQNIIVIRIGTLFLYILDYKLIQANHTFFFFHFIFSQLELKCREISNLENLMKFFFLQFIFLVNQAYNRSYEAKIFGLLIDYIFIVETHLNLFLIYSFYVKISLLLLVHIQLQKIYYIAVNQTLQLSFNKLFSQSLFVFHSGYLIVKKNKNSDQPESNQRPKDNH